MTARLYQFVGNKEAAPENLGENFAAAQTLPELSLDLLEQFFERLSPEDKIQVLRHKIVPVASLPHVTLYAAAGEQRLQDARDAGKRIIGQINPQDLRFTIRRKLGAELLNKATHHLRIRQPASSAFRRITDLQRFWFALMVLVFVVAWATLDGFYFNAALSFLCGGFFLAVIGLRLLCLLTETLKKSTPPNQNDDELPIYTVLVPLFREIRVLDQLVQSMTKLNYPALCIKRTKTE